MEIIFRLNNIESAAKEFLERVREYKIFAFSGDLGAGKTTFINYICRQLGVAEIITSPTYSIIHKYKLNHSQVIYHIDLYRIKNTEEAIEAGVEDCIISGNRCFVEWPQKAFSLFPEETVYATMETLNADTRKLIAQLPQ